MAFENKLGYKSGASISEINVLVTETSLTFLLDSIMLRDNKDNAISERGREPYPDTEPAGGLILNFCAL